MADFEVPVRADLIVAQSCDTPADRVFSKKLIRKSQVLEALRTRGSLSRVEIARTLGFNVSTVSTIVDDLVVTGLAVEEHDRKASIGRPPVPVALNTKAACVLGIDVGKSLTVGTIMDIGNNVVAMLEKESPPAGDRSMLLNFVHDFIVELLRSHKDQLPPIAGIGVALPGILFHVKHSTFYKDVPVKVFDKPVEEFKNRLEELLPVPIMIDGDSRMIALAEMWFGPAKELHTFLVVNITDGLGSTLVVDRKLYYGAELNAGDLGHVQLGQPGIKCFCGAQACLENTASGLGIKRLAAEAGLCRDGKPCGVAEVAQMARDGNPAARGVFDQFAKALAKGVGAQLVLSDPELVVLSGLVSQHADCFMEAFDRELRENQLPGYMKNIQIEVSTLHESAVSRGTCAAILYKIFGVSHISVEDVV